MVAFSSLVLALGTAVLSLAAPAPVSSPDGFNFTLMPRSGSGLGRRQSYQQDYTTGGDVVYSVSGNSFTVKWDTQDDFVCGLGWNPGSTNPINFSGDFEIGSGTALLSVYGWSTNPLVEYYIIESNYNPPSFGSQKGSVSSDGSEYTIWENTRTNEPSIEGTSTFNQYISVRQSQRTSGTVTVENHFNAWANLGMDLGTLNFQVIACEGWGGEGACTQSLSN